MFYDLFTVDKIRRITASNIMHYPNGFIHPNRVLSCHDIVVIINGFLKVYQKDILFEAKAGDFIVLPAGYNHYGKDSSPENTLTCYVHIAKEDGDNPYTISPDTAASYAISQFSGKERCSKVILPTIVHAQNHPELIEQIKKISLESNSYSPYLKTKTDTMMTKFLIDLFIVAMEKYIPKSNIVNQCLSVMQDNVYSLSLEDVARQLNISKSTLMRQFRHATGTSFHKYFMHIRLNMACDLLQTTPESINSITHILGFCDESHFGNCFKQKFGCTPNEYRSKYI